MDLPLPAPPLNTEADGQYRALFERAGWGRFHAAPDGRLISANAALARMSGYDTAEALTAAVTDFRQQLFTASDQRAALLRLLAEQGVAGGFELQLQRRDGARVEVETHVYALREAGGDLSGYEGLVEDITARKQTQAQLERSARQLLTLSQLGQTVAGSLDQTIVLNSVLNEVSYLLNADGVAVLLLDGKQLVLEAVGGAGTVSLVGRRMPAAGGVAGEVIQSGVAVLVDNVAEQVKIHRPVEQFTVYDTGSLLAAPLKLQGQVIGVIEAVHEAPRRFAPDDLQLLEAVASWAAIAIGNARQHMRLQRRLQESEALSIISQALNETHDLDTILQLIVDAARQIIPRVERAIIHLLDENEQILRPAAVASEGEMKRTELSMRPGEGVAGRVLAEGLPINVGDTRTDPRYLSPGQLSPLRSLLVAPVQRGERRLGTISVQSTETYAFSNDDEILLKTLGVQAALAIENARLLQVESTARKDAETLAETAATLSGTLVEWERLMDRLLEQVGRLVPFDAGALLWVDRATGYVRVARSRGYDRLGPAAVRAIGELNLEIAHTTHLRHMVMIGQPARVADTHADVNWTPWPPFAQARSWIGAPIIVQGEGTLAFFSLEKVEPGFYQTEHQYKLAAFTSQASLAIQNARLYADLERALSHEKSMRAQLVQHEKVAAMGRLVASVAHELNNPLQAIQNSLYLVSQDTGLQPQSREDLQIALSEADRMAELIGRLRDTYRPTSAEQFQPVELNTVIDEVHRLIGTHLKHSHVSFKFEPDPDLPAIPAIRDHIKQVFLNLCLNAVEAMPTGGHLFLQTQRQAHTGEVLTVVSDSGGGISPEALQEIFQPFFTTKEGGTGLGLFITQEIITRHQGRIEPESVVGQGTTFRVWLPLSRPDVPPRNGQTNSRRT
jgi:PAS domain S-box-containing protein